MEEENVVADNSNTAEEEVLETSQEESYEETSNESDNELQERLAKAEELANNYRIRAEKAERLAKGKTEAQPKQSKEFDEDTYALLEAKVPREDITEVREYAQLKNISVAEALKSNIVKGILSEKAEQRNTALASHVGASRRSSSTTSEEQLVENARKGILPETDDDIMRYAKAKK